MSPGEKEGFLASELSINILGAPTVTHDSDVIVVARARVRALLWLLAAEDRPLNRERLEYLLWPEETTKVAHRNLSTHVSYAKKALGAEALLVTGTTVALSDAVDTDLRRFNALAASEAADDALGALQLVSGSVLEGFVLRDNEVYEQWQTAFRLMFNQRVVSLTLRTARALMDEGRAETAQRILAQARKSDPFNEEICCLTMRALCDLGQRSEAIGLYHTLVESLSSELGVPPADDTVRCYQEIIGSNKTYLPSVEMSLAADDMQDMPFVGREHSLEFICTHQQAQFLLVQGKSGFGKTRLVREYVNTSGVRAFSVQAISQEAALPFALVRSILRAALASSAEPLSPSALPLDDRELKALRFLLPELHTAGIEASTELTSSHEVASVLGAVLDMVCRHRETVLLIDDIHYADSSSLKALKHLYAHQSFCVPRVIATMRASLAGPELLAFLNDMQRADPTTILELGKLTNESMSILLSYYYPDIDQATAAKLIALADGNPYWLKCIMQGLDDGYTEFSGANSLLNLFNRSLRALSDPARRAVSLLALQGGCCDFELFALWCGESYPSPIFNELAAARLVSRNDLGQVLIAHSRILDFIVESLNPGQHATMQLEYELACSLAAYYDGAGSAALNIADHFMKSSHPETSLPYAIAAANYLVHVDDIAAAIGHYKIAYRYAEQEEKLRIALILIKCYLDTGQLYEMNLYAQNALDYATKHGFEPYILALSASLALTQVPEYHELRTYIYPSYRIDLDPTILERLLRAKTLLHSTDDNRCLSAFLSILIASYAIMDGNVEMAKNELQLTVSAMVGLPERMQRSYLPLLHLHSVVLLVTALNNTDDNQLASAIQAEHHFYDDVPLSGFALPLMESQALSAILAGQQEEGVTLMERAIALAREMSSFGPLTTALLVQAMLVHKENPLRSYTLNHEAYGLAKKHGLRYCLVRALVGLIKTSPSPEDARAYYSELEAFCQAVGDQGPLRKVSNEGTDSDAEVSDQRKS